MNGVRVISSVAVFVFLLCASFCTVIEERSPMRGQEPVLEREFRYLALVDSSQTCSGSIISKSMVLTYCDCNADDTTLYAGLDRDIDMVHGEDKTQIRHVKRVAEHPQEKRLKIIYVNETWEWTDNVNFIALHLKEKRSSAGSCHAVGYLVGFAHKVEQKIGDSSECSFNDNTPGLLYSKTDVAVIEFDRGGPVVCQGEQRAINMFTRRLVVPPASAEPPVEGEKKPTDNLVCNIYLDIAYYRSWILDNIKESTSSVDSIHRFSVKISMNQALMYPPLWLLLLMTVELLYPN